MTTLTHDTRRVGGLALAIVSASAFALSGTLARGLMDAGWSAAAAVTVRILIGGAVLVPVALHHLRGRWGLLRRHAGLITAYGLVAVAGCQLAYFNAVAHMQVGVALLIEYTAPVAVVGWMWLRHGQRPGRLTVLGAAAGVFGLVLVLDLFSGAQANPVGIGWALGAMVGAAVFFVLSAQGVGADGDDPHGNGGALPGTVLAAGGLVVGSAALLLACTLGLLPFDVSAEPVRFAMATVPWWLPVLGLGIVSAAISYVTGIAATRRLGPRLASFVALLEVVIAMVVAWLLLGELPRGVQLLGGALVLVGIVVVKLGEDRPAVRVELADPVT